MAKYGDNPRAVMHTSMGELTLELLDDKAPRTCDNFVKLARNGFYDGLTFHRILKDFMVQGGCPKGNGTGGPGYTIGPEFNETPHLRGVVSMARSNDPHSAGSQFFIVHGDARYLDHKYSAFGRLVDSDEVLDNIASVQVVENRFREASSPSTPVYINRIELLDIEFDDEPQATESGRGEGDGERGGGKGRKSNKKRSRRDESDEPAEQAEQAAQADEPEDEPEAEVEEKPARRKKASTRTDRNDAKSAESKPKGDKTRPAKAKTGATAKKATGSKASSKASTKKADTKTGGAKKKRTTRRTKKDED